MATAVIRSGRRPAARTADQRYDMVERVVDGGRSAPGLARELGVSASAVYHHARRLGVNVYTARKARSLRQLAGDLGVRDGTVRQWVDAGLLRAWRADGEAWWQIFRDERERFMDDPVVLALVDPANVKRQQDRVTLERHRREHGGWLTLKEVADRFCVGRSTVQGWASGGLLPHRVVDRNGKHVFAVRDVETFVPPLDRPRDKRRNMTPETMALLADLRWRQLAWDKIAALVGWPERTCVMAYRRMLTAPMLPRGLDPDRFWWGTPPPRYMFNLTDRERAAMVRDWQSGRYDTVQAFADAWEVSPPTAGPIAAEAGRPVRTRRRRKAAA